MPCKLTVNLDREGLPWVFLVPLPHGPRCFSDILLATVQSCALATLNDSTLLLFGVPVLGLDQTLFNGPITLEMCLNSKFGAGIFDAFPQALKIWDDYMSFAGSSPKVVVVWLLLPDLLVSCNVLPRWLLPFSPWLTFTTLVCILFMAHLGYLILTSASLR